MKENPIWEIAKNLQVYDLDLMRIKQQFKIKYLPKNVKKFKSFKSQVYIYIYIYVERL